MLLLTLPICNRSQLSMALAVLAVACQIGLPACKGEGQDGKSIDAIGADLAGVGQEAPDAADPSDALDIAAADVPGPPGNGKPYCKGSWMCGDGKCVHVLDGQPGIGKYMRDFTLLREKDGSAPGILAGTFYSKVDPGSKSDDWDLVTVSTALLELRADGELRYLSNPVSGAGYGIPARTESGALAMASLVSQTNEPADPHGLELGKGPQMLIVSRLDSGKNLVNLAVLGEWYPVYFRAANAGPTVELVVEPAAHAGTVESSLGPRVYVIDLETGVVKVDKPFLDGKRKGNYTHRGITPKKDYPAWGIANLGGQRVMHEWIWLSDQKVSFSVSKLDENFNLTSKSPETVGVRDAAYLGPDVDCAGNKLYIAGMFGGNHNLATVTPDGLVEQLGLEWEHYKFHGIGVHPTSTGGRIISANGSPLYATASDGTVKWKLDFGYPMPNGRYRADDPFGGKRQWPDWYVSDGEEMTHGVDFHPSRPQLISFGNGRFAHAYQMSTNPIWNPSPYEPGNPPRAANVAPYYLFYFDENGKLLCN